MSHIDPGELHAYADGEISDRERTRIEDHLAACGECRARLDDVRKLSLRASDLLAQLAPAASSAPPWGEIEARGAARESDGQRRNWLKPNLAWAASIALAFVLGWATSNYWDLPSAAFEPPKVVTVSAPADEAEAPTSVDRLSSQEAALRTFSENEPSSAADAGRRPSDSDARNEARRDQVPEVVPSIQPARQLAQEEDRPLPAEAQSAPEAEAAHGDELAETGDQRERTAGAAAGQIVQQTRLSDAAARTADKAVDDFVRDLNAQAAAADPSAGVPLFSGRPDGEVRFFELETGEASAWLGGELRSLAELEVESIRLGPGAAIPGALPNRPAIVIVYRDAAGQEIILVQQLASTLSGLEQSAEELPTLTVEPSGRRAYRWRDDRGYMLMLIGMIESDSLRALADRVR